MQLQLLSSLLLRVSTALQLLHWRQGAALLPVWQLQEGGLGTAGGGSKAPVATLKGEPVGAETKIVAPRVKKRQRPSMGELDQNPFSSAFLLIAALLPLVALHTCPQTRACTSRHCNPAQSSTYVLACLPPALHSGSLISC